MSRREESELSTSRAPTLAGRRRQLNTNLTSNCSRDSLAMSSTSSKSQISAQQMQDLRERFTQFRILVIGRANAGKTTILHRLCNATGDPTIFDPAGKKVKYVIQVHARYSHLCPLPQIESSALDPSLEVNGSLWHDTSVTLH